MQKKKKKLQKRELKERQSQKDLIYSVSIREMIETLDELYGRDRVILTITLPYHLKNRVLDLFPMLEDNKSAVLAYVINQGIVRIMEKEHNATSS